MRKLLLVKVTACVLGVLLLRGTNGLTPVGRLVRPSTLLLVRHVQLVVAARAAELRQIAAATLGAGAVVSVRFLRVVVGLLRAWSARALRTRVRLRRGSLATSLRGSRRLLWLHLLGWLRRLSG